MDTKQLLEASSTQHPTKQKGSTAMQLDKNEVLTTLINGAQLREVLEDTLRDLEEDRKTALEDHELIRDLVANDNSAFPSDAAKQQLSALIQVALDASDKRLKVIDILLRAMGRPGGSHSGSSNAQQTNIYLGDRRELLQSIENAMDPTKGARNNEQKDEKTVVGRKSE